MSHINKMVNSQIKRNKKKKFYVGKFNKNKKSNTDKKYCHGTKKKHKIAQTYVN